ncbi:MAG: helix-turn-helix domain-containing protein [Actinomycetota bacterium]
MSLTVSVGEAAEILGIGRDRVYGLCHSRQLPAVRVGRTFRIPREALQTWLEAAAREGAVL